MPGDAGKRREHVNAEEVGDELVGLPQRALVAAVTDAQCQGHLGRKHQEELLQRRTPPTQQELRETREALHDGCQQVGPARREERAEKLNQRLAERQARRLSVGHPQHCVQVRDQVSDAVLSMSRVGDLSVDSAE
jgi:hypothetical protein